MNESDSAPQHKTSEFSLPSNMEFSQAFANRTLKLLEVITQTQLHLSYVQRDYKAMNNHENIAYPVSDTGIWRQRREKECFP